MSPLTTPPPRTSSLIVDHMHERVRTGEWAIGTRIPAEQDLVREFGVGRNTIREAVRALEHEGLLAPRRGDGTYVRSRNVLTEAIARRVPSEEFAELLVIRRALESEAAALTARLARPEDEVVDAIENRDAVAARKAVHHYLDDALDAAR